MRQNIKGKVALITGAGQGIGRAIAIHLAKEGATVFVNDIDNNKAEQAIAFNAAMQND